MQSIIRQRCMHHLHARHCISPAKADWRTQGKGNTLQAVLGLEVCHQILQELRGQRRRAWRPRPLSRVQAVQQLQRSPFRRCRGLVPHALRQIW